MLTASSALALASCGGADQQVDRRTDTSPTIERAVAERLASRSDKVASLLDAGDACGAAEEAARLRAEVTASISAIPDVYVEDFSAVVNEIQAQMPPCEQPGDDDGNNGKGKGKNKGKDKDEDKDKDQGDD